jgi:hypothetical protein
MIEKKYRKVQPRGKLYTQGQEYYLLKSISFIREEWERGDTYRFLVVPHCPIAVEGGCRYYSFARHIVTTSFTIDYMPTIAPILIWDIDEEG